jgi:hypothetical protein
MTAALKPSKRRLRDRTVADALIAYLPRATERWLVRLRPYILSAVAECPTWWDRDNMCYALVSWKTKHFYIGKVEGVLHERSLALRQAEHVRASAKRGGVQHVHRWMARFGANQYVLVPLAVSRRGETRGVERRLIKLLQPTLNIHTDVGLAAARRKHISVRQRRRGSARPWIHVRRKGEGRLRGLGRAQWSQSVAVVRSSGESYGDLARLFENLVPKAAKDGSKDFNPPVEVEWRPGGWSATDFTRIRMTYGKSLVELDGVPMTMRAAVKLLRRAGRHRCLRIWSVAMTLGRKFRWKRRLAACLRNPSLWSEFSKLTLGELVQHLRTVRVFSKPMTRKGLRAKLYGIIKKKYNVDLQKRLILRYPHHEAVPRVWLRRLVSNVVADLPICEAARVWMTSRARAVATNRPTLAALTHNCRRFAREFGRRPPPCQCAECPLPKRNGHVQMRAAELEGTKWAVLAQNNKNVPRPATANVAAELRAAEGDLRMSVADMRPGEDFSVALSDNGGLASIRRVDGRVTIGKGGVEMLCLTDERMTVLHNMHQRWRVTEPAAYDAAGRPTLVSEVLNGAMRRVTHDARRAVPDGLLAVLFDELGLVAEFLSCPFTVNGAALVYCSDYMGDVTLGSAGSAWARLWDVSGFAAPRDSGDELLRTCRRACASVLATRAPVTIVVAGPDVIRGRRIDYGALGGEVLATYAPGTFRYAAAGRERAGTRSRGVLAKNGIIFASFQNDAAAARRGKTDWARIAAASETAAGARGTWHADALQRAVPHEHADRVGLAADGVRGGLSSVAAKRTKLRALGRDDPAKWRSSRTQVVQGALAEAGRGATCGTDADVQAAMRDMRGMVLGPLDKNAGETWIECGRITWQHYHAWYMQTPDTYTVCEESESEILATMRAEYKTLGLEQVAAWDRKGVLGNVYNIKKAKDPFNRARPISPMHSHPARATSNRSGRALNYSVQRRFGMESGTALWSPFELRGAMAAATRHWKALGEDYDARVVVADAEGMFLRLPHARAYEFIDNHTEWLIDQGVRTIAVRRRGRAGCSFGKAPSAAFIEITPLQLRAALRYGVKWLYCTLGEFVLRQTHGFPMGMPSSHPLSVAICCWDEAQWRTSLRTDVRYIDMKRYVDDAIAIFFTRRNDAAHAALVAKVEEAWRTRCLDEHLVMVQTSTSDVEADMMDMEVEVNLDQQRITTTHLDKNARALLLTGEYKVVRYNHYHSYVPLAALRGVVISSLLRMRWNTTDPLMLLSLVGAYAVELRELAYPRSVLLDAVRRCARADPEGNYIWDGVRRIVLAQQRDAVMAGVPP